MKKKSSRKTKDKGKKGALVAVLGVVAAAVIALTPLGKNVKLLDALDRLGIPLPKYYSSQILDDIPPYSGDAWVELYGNIPGFTEEEKTTEVFEIYSPLDMLDRCGTAYANICTELMPTGPRDEIGSVKPTGWQLATYDFIDGRYLYNRCHLIGFQLAGENANELNLITGTRYLNIEGMLPFENEIADYVGETGNHVLYRVTPVYQGGSLVAQGVQMEGWSVEDGGTGICFNVYAYNVQPGVEIDYATGDNWAEEQVTTTR